MLSGSSLHIRGVILQEVLLDSPLTSISRPCQVLQLPCFDEEQIVGESGDYGKLPQGYLEALIPNDRISRETEKKI